MTGGRETPPALRATSPARRRSISVSESVVPVARENKQ